MCVPSDLIYLIRPKVTTTQSLLFLVVFTYPDTQLTGLSLKAFVSAAALSVQ